MSEMNQDAVRCRGCDDTRDTSCGAEDCPVPLQLAGDLNTPDDQYAPTKYEKLGFSVGVLTVTWSDEPPFDLAGRGPVRTAEIVACHTTAECLPREVLTAAITGCVVYAPDGSLVRIAGVESHCITPLGVGQKLGLLLAPMEDR